MNRMSQRSGAMPLQPPLNPAQGWDQDDDFIDLARLLRALLRYKWGILGLALAITLVAGLYVNSLTPIYSATVSIELKPAETNMMNVDDYSRWRSQDEYYYNETQFEILKSRSLAERVVRRLKLHEHPYYKPAETPAEKPSGFTLKTLLPARQKAPPVQLTPEEKEARLISGITGSIAGGLTISPVEYSYVTYISYESPNPQLAAQIVNTVAEEFIASDLDGRLEGTLQATDWLDQRLAYLRDQLGASELALQEFREAEGLVSVEGVTGLGSSELAQLSQRLDDARRERMEAQNIKDEVQGMGGASTAQLMTVPAVLQHQLIRELKRDQSSAERKVAELAKRYGAKHPKMIAAQSDLNAANEDLVQEVRKVVSGINREYELARRNEQQLQATWEASKSELQEFNRIEFQLQELQRDVTTNRQLYDIFLTRIKTVSETGGFEKPHARVLDRALIPSGPVRPNKRRSVTLAFVLGIVLGCGVALLLELLDNTIKRPDEVEEKLHVPLLGTIPKQKLGKEGDFEQFWQQPQSQYAEAIRTLRTSVLLSSLDEPAGIIVVTSTVPGEGKSTTALNLGAALAQMESTLVIGADLRRPSLAKKVALAPNHKGLSHFVAGTAELEQCIEQVEALGLHVMPAGIIPPNPLEMISSKKFVLALETLRQRFDRIIIDSAPVQAVSDALVLASYADSVIYVVKADATSATAAQKGISNIVASNEPLTGVVLNHFDTKKAGRYYGSDYYSQYGNYYQAAEDTTEGATKT